MSKHAGKLAAATQLAWRWGLCAWNKQSLSPVQLPIEDLCSLSSRSLQSPFAATVPASTEDILHKGFQMLAMENDRIETAQQVDWLASLNSFVPKQTCRASIRCSVEGLLLCVAVFFLVCQTTNKDGPGWECKIQVRKGLNALWHADFSVTAFRV